MSIPPTQPQPAADPLASLHKMSRTAGLGSTEYVEVNATAVVALLLGLLSSLAVLGTFLLIIPVVTLVVAIIAIRQIRRSAGTQTGTAVAWLGLLLALAFVGFIGGREVLAAKHARAETNQIMTLIEQLGQDLSKSDYDSAWLKFSDRFKQRVKKEEFVSKWQLVQGHALYGQIKTMKSNGLVDVKYDDESGQSTAQGVILIDLPDGKSDRREGLFRKVEQAGWQVEDIGGFFPAPEPKPGAARPPG